jgi:putative SOS response-associated peptidase YedK
MCYDVATYLSADQIRQYFPELVIEPALADSIQPHDHLLAQSFPRVKGIVFENGAYRLKDLEWGVVTEFMDSPEKIREFRKSYCNATIEKLLNDKRSYWYRIRNKRCLIPVTGFYEHREVKGFKNKIPYFISMKNRPVFCLPAVYHYNPLMADLETGLITETFSVLTRPANHIMSLIHNSGFNKNRMPVMFANEAMEKKWLDPELDSNSMKQLLEYEIPYNLLNYHTVYSIRGNKPRPDGKRKFEPFSYPGLPPLGLDEVKEGELF